MKTPTDREARFERVYDEYAGRVLAYALRRASPDWAADVAAETFLIAWRRLDTIPAEAELPWLYATERRVLSTQRRSAHRQEAIAERVAAETPTPPPPTTLPEGGAPRIAMRALARLSAEEREVLLLTAWEELSSREAAASLGCSPTAYRIRLHRARKRLRQQMAALEDEPARHQPRPATAKESSSC
jgi:RNA polymerase sigma-70 factor (ECF subfamily)